MDDILKQTLETGTGAPTLPTTPKGLIAPDLTGNNPNDIKTLAGAQQKPSTLLNFQGVMQKTAQQAYNERQSQELGSIGFDPTKVSGGTFSSIIGNLEANRGADISKIYASTLSTYSKIQDTITSQLESLRALEEQKRQFQENLKLEKKKIQLMEKENKSSAKMEKEKMKEDTRRWELEYAMAKSKIKNNLNTITQKNEDAAFNTWQGNGSPNGGMSGTPKPSFGDFISGFIKK